MFFGFQKISNILLHFKVNVLKLQLILKFEGWNIFSSFKSTKTMFHKYQISIMAVPLRVTIVKLSNTSKKFNLTHKISLQNKLMPHLHMPS